MDAKRLRLAKWKQAKQAEAKQAETHKADPQRATDPAQTQIPEASPSSPAVHLNFAGIKRKARSRVTLEDSSVDVEDRPEKVSRAKLSADDSQNGASESIDDVLNSLDSRDSLQDSMYASEPDDESSGEDPLAARKKPKRVSSKLDTVIVDHSTEPFEKNLFNSVVPHSVDAEAFRLTNGIKVEGSDLAPLVHWHVAGLPLPLMRTIESQGFDKPTPIQAQSLPVIMSGSDLVGIAPTSSGKTIAFLLPLCRHVAANRAQHKKMSKGPYALVLAPTRELCMQIFREVEPLATALQLKALGCYGGTDISTQISELINGRCDIMVATPGRLIDLLATNHGRVFSLRGVTFLVVDETDRMFDLGFGPQVRAIVGAVRRDRQTVVFSATMSSGMESLVSRILTNPVKVIVEHQSVIPPQISQEVILINERKEKMPALLEALNSVEDNGLALVFVDTQDKADALALQLMAKGFRCQALHGGMDQQDRAATISEFRTGALPVLVATSIAARGLDVRQLKLVVNFDAASHLEDYVHRAGRTGRAGGKGKSLTLLEKDQKRQAHDLAKLFKVPEDVESMATEYAQTKSGSEPERFGFGGHGLANLEKKRSIKKAVEHDAYAPRDESKEPEPETSTRDAPTDPALSVVTQEGGSFVIRLPINDKPKEGRVAVTSAGNQAKIVNEFRVSITIRGTFYPRPKKDINDDEKLHLHIEGETHESVLGAFSALNDLLDNATAKQGGRYMLL